MSLVISFIFLYYVYILVNGVYNMNKKYAVFGVKFGDKPYMEDCIGEDVTLEEIESSLVELKKYYSNIRWIAIDNSRPDFTSAINI